MRGDEPGRETVAAAPGNVVYQQSERRGRAAPSPSKATVTRVERAPAEGLSGLQEACDRAGLVDFAELLLRAHELWLDKTAYPAALSRTLYRCSLVGDSQDTDDVQYAWIRLLAGDTGKVMIVGDDDQSIYGWRGAGGEHPALPQQVPGAETIRLEQTHRSTSNILSAANALIENNNGGPGKKLWTDGATANRFTSTARLTNWMKRALW
ncbi:UvrD-helicase domain-containing protein [Shigella flexneri]